MNNETAVIDGLIPNSGELAAFLTWVEETQLFNTIKCGVRNITCPNGIRLCLDEDMIIERAIDLPIEFLKLFYDNYPERDEFNRRDYPTIDVEFTEVEVILIDKTRFLD